jgi:hypothetical protein
MTGTYCDLFTHKSSRSYLNHLVLKVRELGDHVERNGGRRSGSAVLQMSLDCCYNYS